MAMMMVMMKIERMIDARDHLARSTAERVGGYIYIYIYMNMSKYFLPCFWVGGVGGWLGGGAQMVEGRNALKFHRTLLQKQRT
jgi:hypothetical protein